LGRTLEEDFTNHATIFPSRFAVVGGSSTAFFGKGSEIEKIAGAMATA
jgi:hypothetical protein